MKMYEAPRTVLVFTIIGTLVFGWLGISGFLDGYDLWRPIVALSFAVMWLVVGLSIWRKSKAQTSFRNDSPPAR